MDMEGTDAQVPDAEDVVASLSIGDLAKHTGLSPATLRVWETRHGFPVPQRLESGHRRYSDTDVEQIRAVLRRKDAGTRLEQAIAQTMAAARPGVPSVYAELRRHHPALGVYRLRKSTLLAMSWAIEDEFCAKADRANIWGAFQEERHYRAAQPRWSELARVAAGAVVLAGFAQHDPDASPVEVALTPDAPMRREWAVVCDAVDLPVVLTAWELPGQDATTDRERIFESMWTVDPEAVRDAARVCAAVARDAGATGLPDELHEGRAVEPDGRLRRPDRRLAQSRTRPRIDFTCARRRFPSTRRRCEPLVGFVGTRVRGGGPSASRSWSASRTRAATRLRCCERCSEALTTSRGPSRLTARARWVSVSDGEPARSSESSTRLSVVFTDCPPGPDDFENCSTSSPAGITRPSGNPGPARTTRSWPGVTATPTPWRGRCPSPSVRRPHGCARGRPRR